MGWSGRDPEAGPREEEHNGLNGIDQWANRLAASGQVAVVGRKLK